MITTIYSFVDAPNRYNRLASTFQVRLDVRNLAVKEAKTPDLLESTLHANKSALCPVSIQKAI